MSLRTFKRASLNHFCAESNIRRQFKNKSNFRKTYVELANGEEDWVQTRNCFVRAFQNYPLYKHIIRDDKKRPEFLKQYLEAIYEVTVRKGNSILICGKAVERDDETATVLNVSLFVVRNSLFEDVF